VEISSSEQVNMFPQLFCMDLNSLNHIITDPPDQDLQRRHQDATSDWIGVMVANRGENFHFDTDNSPLNKKSNSGCTIELKAVKGFHSFIHNVRPSYGIYSLPETERDSDLLIFNAQHLVCLANI